MLANPVLALESDGSLLHNGSSFLLILFLFTSHVKIVVDA